MKTIMTLNELSWKISNQRETVPATPATKDGEKSPNEEWFWDDAVEKWKARILYKKSLGLAWTLIPEDPSERSAFMSSGPFLSRLGVLGHLIWTMDKDVARVELLCAWYEWKTGAEIEVVE